MLSEKLVIYSCILQLPPVFHRGRYGIQIVDPGSVHSKKKRRVSGYDELASAVMAQFLKHFHQFLLHPWRHAVFRFIQAVKGIVFKLFLKISERRLSVAVKTCLLPSSPSYELTPGDAFAAGHYLHSEGFIVIHAL